MAMPKGYVVKSLIERFVEKIEIDLDGCWHWRGFLDKAGYGRIRSEGGREGESVYTHRLSYELYVGPVPPDKFLDHLCRHRYCCNPEHLEPVTLQENTKRGSTLVLTGKCKRGHVLTSENIYWRKDRPGQWNCLQCRREDRERAKLS